MGNGSLVLPLCTCPAKLDFLLDLHDHRLASFWLIQVLALKAGSRRVGKATSRLFSMCSQNHGALDYPTVDDTLVRFSNAGGVCPAGGRDVDGEVAGWRRATAAAAAAGLPRLLQLTMKVRRRKRLPRGPRLLFASIAVSLSIIKKWSRCWSTDKARRRRATGHPRRALVGPHQQQPGRWQPLERVGQARPERAVRSVQPKEPR